MRAILKLAIHWPKHLCQAPIATGTDVIDAPEARTANSQLERWPDYIIAIVGDDLVTAREGELERLGLASADSLSGDPQTGLRHLIRAKARLTHDRHRNDAR